MDVEVLVVPDCPHAAAAIGLTRQVLADLDLAGTPIRISEIDTLVAARRRGFVGSPTILINGIDPFPAAGQPPAVACRVYPGASGVSPLPDRLALRQALIGATGDSARH